MAYVPDDAQWFLAQIIEEIRVEGSKRNIIHINHVLVEASCPEVAYMRALEIGEQSETEYENPFGKNVTIKFRGLRNLDVIHFPLEHGSEIMFVEKLGMSEAGVKKLVRSKDQLEAFRPIRKRRGRPSYASRSVLDEMNRALND